MAYSDEDIKSIWPCILEELESGKSMREVLRAENMPSRPTVYAWLDSDEEKINQYARATKIRADILVEEIIEIADKQDKDVIQTLEGEKIDHNIIHRNRLQIDARKWAASKMNPKKYGDKLGLEHSGEIKTADLSDKSTDELIKRAEAIKEIKNSKDA